jgi:hypothetical protein
MVDLDRITAADRMRREQSCSIHTDDHINSRPGFNPDRANGHSIATTTVDHRGCGRSHFAADYRHQSTADGISVADTAAVDRRDCRATDLDRAAVIRAAAHLDAMGMPAVADADCRKNSSRHSTLRAWPDVLAEHEERDLGLDQLADKRQILLASAAKLVV